MNVDKPKSAIFSIDLFSSTLINIFPGFKSE